MSRQVNKTASDRFYHLLMGAIDGELTPKEHAEFTELVATHPEFKQEWQQYQQLKEVTQTMKFKSPPTEVWDKYWLNVYNRIERGIAWIIFSIGFMILLIYGSFKIVESLLADSQLVGIVKIGILAAIIGLVILIVSVLREKLMIQKTDPYKEVQR